MAEDRDRFESPASEEALEAEDESKAAIRESVEAGTGYEPGFEAALAAERRLDLNTASEADLQELPGLGPELAAEIVAYRTETGGFREAAEVTHVPGITVDVYDRFADRVTAGREFLEESVDEEGQPLPWEAAADIAEEPLPILEEPPPILEEPPPILGEPPLILEEPLPILEKPPVLKAEESLVADKPLPAKEAPQPLKPVRAATTPRRGIGWPSLLVVGLLSAVAGALLSLLVLWLLNGTLDMQQTAERRLQNEAFRLDGEMEAIRAQVVVVEGRMAGIESMAGDLEQARGDIRDLGSSVDALRTDINSATRRIEDMQATLAGLSDDMVNVEESVTDLGTQLGDVEARLGTMGVELAEAQKAITRFDAFLAGLRALLSETAATDGTATEVPTLRSMTPLAGPTGSPTPATTPRPRVTVIPLATRTPVP